MNQFPANRLKQIFDYAQRVKKAIAIFRLPDKKTIHVFYGNSNLQHKLTLDKNKAENKFYLAPFNYPKDKLVVITPETCTTIKKLEIFEAEIKQTPDQKPYASFSDKKLIETKKSAYLKQIKLAKLAIDSGCMEKTVLSRTTLATFPGKLHPIDFFLRVQKDYPKTFSYILYTQESGIWTGATPELLCSHVNHEFKTVSLAGTLPTDNSKKWSKKEKAEQQYVTDYIKTKILEVANFNLKISKPFTYRYGNIKHLKTHFSIKQFDYNKLENIIQKLHPTPAVCGLPTKTAKDFIQKTEQYDRSFYTGFLGPQFEENETYFFVNLRCAKINPPHIQLFAGGGLTAESDPEIEWEETNWKLNALKKYL